MVSWRGRIRHVGFGRNQLAGHQVSQLVRPPVGSNRFGARTHAPAGRRICACRLSCVSMTKSPNIALRRHRSFPLSLASCRTGTNRPGAPHGGTADQGRKVPCRQMNIEQGHAILAGHSFEHELARSAALGIFGSIDMNRNDYQSGWDTDQYPNSVPEVALAAGP